MHKRSSSFGEISGNSEDDLWEYALIHSNSPEISGPN